MIFSLDLKTDSESLVVHNGPKRDGASS